ncbi:cation efflux family domain-containing protein [Ditylenchus destructor]|nr:cation efflux family domain-containing protein [Ditylenchus destructor]
MCKRSFYSSGVASCVPKDPFKVDIKRLFKVARSTDRRSLTYDDDKIAADRAISIFSLTKEHLNELPKPAPQKGQRSDLYYVQDVYNKAVQVHGSAAALYTKRRPLLAIKEPLSESERADLRLRIEERSSTTTGANRVVKIALCCNALDFGVKFTAGLVTGSHSLIAEGIHSLTDTINQALLCLGIYFSSRNPNPNFPYGYGNVRYITSLIAGCGILGLGSGISIYHGVSGLLHPVPLEPLNYAFMALAFSLIFQGTSLYNAVKEIRTKAAFTSMSFWRYIRISGDPALNVVFREDAASVTGVLIASAAVSASAYYNNPFFDCCGSIAIGTLLFAAAASIIQSNALHLVGRSLPQHTTDSITTKLQNDPVVRFINDVKATSLGVDKSRFKAEVEFNGEEIARKYLQKNCNMNYLLEEFKAVKDEEELKKLLITHIAKGIEQVGDETDRLEKEIRKKHPEIRHIDLESN